MTPARLLCVAGLLVARQLPQESPRPLRAHFVPGRLPFAFEPNVGQAADDVDFVAHRGSAVFLFSSTRVLVAAGDRTLTLTLPGASVVPGVGEERLSGIANYFIGAEPSRWRTRIPTYARVKFENVYPGIHLVWHGEGGEPEYDFVVEPGADLARIHLASTAKLEPPLVYQHRRGGRRERVAGEWVALGDGTFGFQAGPHDPSLELIIDPTLSYSTYLGGASFDTGSGIAVDATGAYVTGYTQSANFPTASARQVAYGGSTDAFVAKLDSSGTALVYSTYLGGSDADHGNGIAVDGTGQAHVTGDSVSLDFPTASAFQMARAGSSSSDAFVAKLAPAGDALVYSTYLGGNFQDWGGGIALDTSGSAYVTGLTQSQNFPTANALQVSYGGGQSDAFVTKLSASGASLVFSTYLGGDGNDVARSLALDAAGSAYVLFATASTNLPVVSGVQMNLAGGPNDAFVAKLTPSGAALAYSTYLGGAGDEDAFGIAVDAAGSAYVTGWTTSTDFPTALPTQATNRGGQDVFLAKLSPAGSALVRATYLGGSGTEQGRNLVLDTAGNVYVTGATTSTDFPVVRPTQGALRGSSDVFVASFSGVDGALSFSTFLGGSQSETGTGIAVDGAGAVYVTGTTSSSDFPTVTPVQPSPNGSNEDFVFRVLTDGGETDAGATDAGATDAGATDAGATDAGATDAGATDAGAIDGGVVETNPPVLRVGCGCSTAPVLGALVLVAWRALTRSRRMPRPALAKVNALGAAGAAAPFPRAPPRPRGPWRGRLRRSSRF